MQGCPGADHRVERYAVKRKAVTGRHGLCAGFEAADYTVLVKNIASLVPIEETEVK